MEDKIILYAQEHPILFSIIVPIILGIIVSFFIEVIKYALFGVQIDKNEDRQKIDNIVWRVSTVALSALVAYITLSIVSEALGSIYIQILFVITNTSVPFMFYHFKGKDLIFLTIGKLFKKFEKTDL